MTLHRFTTIAAFVTMAFGAASAALAQEVTPEPTVVASPAAQPLSRAAVKAELARAQAEGELVFTQPGYIQPLRSTATRAEVTGALREAARTGELASYHAEAYGYAPVTAVGARKAALAWVAAR